MVSESASPPAAPRAHAAIIDGVLGLLGRVRTGDPEPVADSLLNDNYRVPTDTGDLFIRIHQKGRSRERVLREQRVAMWAGERGVPVLKPLADARGATTWNVRNRWVSVYPFVAGRTLRHDALDPNGAALLGELQGQLHATLRDFPAEGMPESSELTWDTEASIALLSRVDDLIRYYPAPGEARLRAQRGLRERLELLESAEPRPSFEFAMVPRQVTHGDFHERNVLFSEDGQVLAVVDWEGTSLAPRVFELLRAIAFMRLWEPPLLDAYLDSYRRSVSLEREECEAGVEMWWQHDLHDTRAFREVFIEGNRRFEPFLEQNATRLAVFRDPAFRRALAEALAGG